MIELELNIPLNFFDSADSDNEFESVTERMAKQFIKCVLNKGEIRRGNDKIKEPDYITDGMGFEVTLAIENSLVPQLKGLRELNTDVRNSQKELIKDILKAVNKKSSKKYSCDTSLIIITLDTQYLWYYELYDSGKDYSFNYLCHFFQKNRNNLFDDVYDNYIKNGIFKNVYIIMPTINSEFALFDLKKYGERINGYIAEIKASKPQAFPHYRITNVKKRCFNNRINFRTTVINWVK